MIIAFRLGIRESVVVEILPSCPTKARSIGIVASEELGIIIRCMIKHLSMLMGRLTVMEKFLDPSWDGLAVR